VIGFQKCVTQADYACNHCRWPIAWGQRTGKDAEEKQADADFFDYVSKAVYIRG
jgi:hypothetical protein